MKYRLGELIENVSKTYDLKNKESVTFVNTGDVFDGSISGNKTKVKDLPGQAKKSIELNDILFSEIRPKNKRFALVTGIDSKNYVVSTKLMVLRNKNNLILDTKYLYLYLTSPLMLAYFQSEAESRSGTFPQITFRENVANIKIDLPPLIEQRKIVQRLSVINDKVKLNNQINDNLATLKTSIFDKLFKNKMSSHLNGNLSNITIITSGKRPKKKFDNKSSVAKYPIVGASKIMGYTDRYLYNESILTTGRVGTHGVIQRFRKPVWVSDNSFVFKTEHEDYLFEILNNWIKYSALNRGSTQPLITQTDLKNIDIYVPTKEEFYHFESVVTPLTDQQFSLISENDNLKKAKAALLSKLF